MKKYYETIRTVKKTPDTRSLFVVAVESFPSRIIVHEKEKMRFVDK